MNPMELFDVGTTVRVQNKIGTVVKAAWVQACNGGGCVPLHTIRYTHLHVHRSGCQKPFLKPLDKPQTSGANYAFVERYTQPITPL